MRRVVGCVLLLTSLMKLSVSQEASAKRLVIACDDKNPCSHRYDNGELLKTLSGPSGVSVTVALEESKNGKYFRIRLGVVNDSKITFDLAPEAFLLDVPGRKPKVLKPIPPDDMERAAERAAFWVNFLTAASAQLARDTVRTTTTSSSQTSGNLTISSLNGVSGYGSYNERESSVTKSTTSMPDYAARAQAAQAIRDRNELVAAENARIAQTALRENTLEPGQTASGFVYFKSATADEVLLRVVIADTEYAFEF